jgi:acetyl-CoA carboxylase biotin carboxyl carrier protein
MTKASGTIYDAIERTVRRLEREHVSMFEYEDQDVYLCLTLGGPGADRATREIKPGKSAQTVKTPAAGIFTSAHPVDRRKSATGSGTAVRAGQIVGYLQIGPVLRPVTAPCDGVLGRQLIDDNVLVGARQSVFELYGSNG